MSTPELDWSPYDSRGTASRVGEFVTHGKVEFELCCEGGLYMIRRTDRTGKRVVVSEAGRGLSRPETLELWKLIANQSAGVIADVLTCRKGVS